MRVTTVDDRCRLFFRLFFDDFEFSIFPKKVIGPDASENVLGRLFDDFQFFDVSEKGYGARCFGKSFGSSFRRLPIFRFFRQRLWGQMLRKKFWVIFPRKVIGPDASENVLGHPGVP